MAQYTSLQPGQAADGLVDRLLWQTLLFCGELYQFVADFISAPQTVLLPVNVYSTVTDFARLRGLSTSVPRASAV